MIARPADWPPDTSHDLDCAEMERCRPFSDYTPAEDAAYFCRQTPEEWQALLRRWRAEDPEGAAAVDRSLSGPLPGSSPPPAPASSSAGRDAETR